MSNRLRERKVDDETDENCDCLQTERFRRNEMLLFHLENGVIMGNRGMVSPRFRAVDIIHAFSGLYMYLYDEVIVHLVYTFTG